MRLRAIILSFAYSFILLGCGRDLPKTISSEEWSGVEREVFNIEKYPDLAAVGKLNFIGNSWCSIILVSEDVALTAGHCFTKANIKFDLSGDLNPNYTSVIFKTNGRDRLENISIKRVLKSNLDPDFAIVKLSRRILLDEIEPLGISSSKIDELKEKTESLGCAGFNGDKELGSEGWLMTISRNIRLFPESSSENRIDANCYSTYGGSGGLFFEERVNSKTNEKEQFLAGVIWGVMDGELNEKGEFVKDKDVITSITPAGVFYEDLMTFMSKDQIYPP